MIIWQERVHTIYVLGRGALSGHMLKFFFNKLANIHNLEKSKISLYLLIAIAVSPICTPNLKKKSVKTREFSVLSTRKGGF